MKKLLLLSMLLIVAKMFTYAQSAGCEELFFSEYIDGPNKNKVLEIYNPKDSTISLAGYSIKIFQNGAPTPITIFLSGSIAPKETYVVAHFQADSAVLSKANMVSPMMNFDGNDAVVLNKGQSTYVDKIGEIGVEPGNSGWFVPPNGSTKEHDLRRKLPIDRGQPDWVQGKTEWNIHPKDSVANLKKHKSVCAIPTIQWELASSTYDESHDIINFPKIELIVTISSPPVSDVNVQIDHLVDQSQGCDANNTSDINLYTNQIIFLQGQMFSKIVEVGIWEDVLPESDEVACFDLTTFSIDASIGTPSRHKLTIIDNDGMGINEVETDNIKVYPFVAKNDLFIKGIRDTKDLMITVNNVLGQEVMSLSFGVNEELKIDVRNLEQGFYFLNLLNENTVISKKFIKE